MANCWICTIEFNFEGQKHSFILHDKQCLTWNNLTVLIWFMNVLSRLLLASFIICFTEAAKEPKEKQLLCPKTFAVRDRRNKYAFKIRWKQLLWTFSVSFLSTTATVAGWPWWKNCPGYAGSYSTVMKCFLSSSNYAPHLKQTSSFYIHTVTVSLLLHYNQA